MRILLPGAQLRCKESLFILLLALLLPGCILFKPSPKTAFVDGVYRMVNDTTKTTVYIAVEEDSLNIYPYDRQTSPQGNLTMYHHRYY